MLAADAQRAGLCADTGTLQKVGVFSRPAPLPPRQTNEKDMKKMKKKILTPCQAGAKKEEEKTEEEEEER